MVLDVVHAGLEADVEHGGADLGQAAAQRVDVLAVRDDAGIGEAVLVVDRAERLLDGEGLPWHDDLTVHLLGAADEVLVAPGLRAEGRGELAGDLGDAPVLLGRGDLRLGGDHGEGHGPAVRGGAGGAGVHELLGQGVHVDALPGGRGHILRLGAGGALRGAVDGPAGVRGRGLDRAHGVDDGVVKPLRVQDGGELAALSGDDGQGGDLVG